MFRFLVGFFLIFFTGTSVYANARYDARLETYVKKRLFKRTANGSPAKSAQEMIDKLARTPMKLDVSSLRCLGYPSPNNNGKAVGACLISGEDGVSAGEHLQQTYVILISADIEHSNVSRQWSVHIQQHVYF